jgi:hypothetical protein
MSQRDDEALAYTRGMSPLTADQLLELKLEPLEYNLAPCIPAKALVMIYGPRGIGKTYVALGIACAVAAGATFLTWQAPKPRKVLVIDGEMPGALLQQRFADTIVNGGYDIPPDNFRLLAADLEPDGLPDLASPNMQRFYANAIADAELIIVDNLTTICRSLRENEADSWGPVQSWALQQRREGRAVMFVHHAGKGGGQRGTSRKEDILNTVISLRKPPDYSPANGARFEVHYEKARGFFGNDAEPFEAWLQEGRWTIGDIARGHDDGTIKSLKGQGLSIREIAERTGIPKSTVDRRLKGLDS